MRRNRSSQGGVLTTDPKMLNGLVREEVVAGGIGSIMRDDFNGSGVGALAVGDQWTFSLDPAMTAAASASALAITTGTSASKTTTLLSVHPFSVPMRAIFAFRQSVAKQANQYVRLELVAVDENGALDENNRIWIETTPSSATATALQTNTVTDGIVGTAVAMTGVNYSTTDQLCEISFDSDQAVFSIGTMNSTTRSATVVRDNNLPNIYERYKLRITVANDVGFAGVTNAISLYYATCLETAETQAEITGSRSSANTVQVTASGTVTANEGTALVPTTSNVTSTASTNATSTKNTAGTVYGIDLFNNTASTVYLKLYNKASAPTVGTDTPFITIPVAAGAFLTINFGRLGRRMGTGIAWAMTGAAADSDTTAVAAGCRMVLSYI